MDVETCARIAEKINKIAKGNGVTASLDFGQLSSNPTLGRGVWELTLTYDGYYYAERLNSHMSITDDDVNDVAVQLLSKLFNDYFSAKVSK